MYSYDSNEILDRDKYCRRVDCANDVRRDGDICAVHVVGVPVVGVYEARRDADKYLEAVVG